jgi:hypothetical protein
MSIANKTKDKFRICCARTSGLALVLTLCAAFLLLPVAGWGQQVTASITGKVTDPSGAAITDAKVVATDTERGTPWPTVTNGEGVFSLPRLPVGTYNVRVEHAGFQAAVQSNILLQINQASRLDITLTVGSVQQTVEVTSAAPLLQTESTEVGLVIDSRTNEELPLATRNYVQLTLLAPGSIHPDPSSFKNGATTGSSGRPNVNGNREQANNFMLDGLDNNQVSDNLVGYAPGVEAIQEFNEITLTAPAEFGNYMGAVVNATTKSGTNQFHGSAFEFFRNDKLNANSWSNNFLGGERSAVRWNSFGATTGGPIKKDKMFFFVDYQGQRLDTPTSVSYTSVYTAAERTGDFSALLDPAQNSGSITQLYNPYSLGSNGIRAPYTNNLIPGSQLSPVASKIVNSTYYPTQNRPGLVNNYAYGSTSAINGDQGDLKYDWNISDKDRFFARYSQSTLSQPGTNQNPLSYNSFQNAPTHTGVMDWTHTLNASLVNEARFGVNYVFLNSGAASNGLSGFAQTVGIPDVPSSFLPNMSISGGNVAGFGTNDVYQLFADAVIHYEDTMIYTKGNHTMHFGFQGFRYRIDTFYSGNNGRAGEFNFNGYYTTSTPGNSAGGAYGGAGAADFLMGLPYDIQGGVNGGTWGQRSNSLAAFFQDDWRVTSHLTLNLGLRWELHTPWDEVDNRQANFNLQTGAEYISGQSCPYNDCNALYNQYNGITNFQPRVGIAWTPGGGKLVVRAGYSLSNYLEGTGTNLRLAINPPFAVEHENNYTSGYSTTLPGSTLDQGFTPFLTNAGNQFAGVGLRVWDPNIRPAVANQWNLTLQEQITPSMTVTAAYVGQRTTHLMVPMPYFQKVLNPDGTVSPTRYLAGNPDLLAVIGNISGTATIGDQSYNSLQLTAQQRLSAGLQFSASYTYSKCMTDNIGYYGQGGQTAQVNWYYQNIYDAAAEWGPCEYDAASNFVANAVYSLPFGRNQKFGRDMNKAVDAVVGGWHASGILSLHSGFPMTIGGGDASGTGSRGARADCVAPATIYGKQNSPLGGYQWFDPTAFAAASEGTFGSCGVGTVRGPGLKTLDFNMTKSFAITERQHVELRGDFINLFNTPILNAPNNYLGTTLGLLQSAQGQRNVQLGLKYTF